MYRPDLDAFLLHLAAAGRAGTTIELRRWHLERLFVWAEVPPFAITEDQLIAYMAQFGWKPETRKSVRASIRSFYQWGVKTGRTERDPSVNLPQVTVPAGVPHPTPTDVLDAALDAASPQALLMLMLAAYAGLRRAEIAGLHSSNIVGDTLVVTGKGGRTRNVPLHPTLAAALQGHTGYIFPGKDHGHLSPDWVGRLMARTLGKNDWTAHSLRHRFATRAYAGQRDILTVQQLLGHSSVATTQRYTEVPDDAKRRAVLSVA
jgi:integrase/recombinase XerC